MYKEISIDDKLCELMKPVKKPTYGSRTILTDSCWEYVSLFLKRQSTQETEDSRFYWEQAHNFYLASLSLPDSAKPLTSYYCILNAAKSLLRFKGIEDKKLRYHGLSGKVNNLEECVDIKKIETEIKEEGVLPQLNKYYNPENILLGKYSITNLMYNISCIHRAYCITFNEQEIFIPIYNPVYVVEDKNAWLNVNVKGRYDNSEKFKDLPSRFEYDTTKEGLIRANEKFEWDIDKSEEERKQALNNYHQKMREHIFYIYGEQKLWYLKRNFANNKKLSNIATPVLIFSVFHWLSELVRYNPKIFKEYMESEQNWLFHEFINTALDQFIDEISCEITGNDIMCTRHRK